MAVVALAVPVGVGVFKVAKKFLNAADSLGDVGKASKVARNADAATAVGKADGVGDAAKAGARADDLAAKRVAGRSFEDRVARDFGETLNRGKGQISVSGTEGKWIPDFKGFGEAKMVHGKLSYSRQLGIAGEWAQENGRAVRLYVLPETTFTGPLQEAINKGLFKVIPAP